MFARLSECVALAFCTTSIAEYFIVRNINLFPSFLILFFPLQQLLVQTMTEVAIESI